MPAAFLNQASTGPAVFFTVIVVATDRLAELSSH
jgi:hypothetical protein